MISRRAIMQAIGLTSVSIPSAAAQLPAFLAAPGTKAGLGIAKCTDSLAKTPAQSYSNPIWQTLTRMTEEYQRELDVKDQIRYRSQFDGDIQALRSVSLVNKQRMQFEREIQSQWLLMQANRMRYG
jgi:hypothetical protein